MSAERDARLILASLVLPKFKGRTALLKLAEAGDDTALDALEMTPRELEIALVRGKLSKRVTSFFSENPRYQEAMGKRYIRQDPVRRGTGGAGKTRWDESYINWRSRFADDPLKERAPGETPKRFVLEIFEKSLRRAGFRTPSGGNTTVTTFVPPGQAAVKVEHGSVRRKGSGWWKLTTTRHWRVSSDILKVPAKRDDGSRWDGKYLWLAPDVRVRQGRGVDLVVERRSEGKWQISKPTTGWIEGKWETPWR